MLQWVENKEESRNQSAINRRLFISWMVLVVICMESSAVAHKSKSPVVLGSTWWDGDKEMLVKNKKKNDCRKSCSIQLLPKHQHLLVVQLLGGLKSVVIQVRPDRFTMSMVEVLHS